MDARERTSADDNAAAVAPLAAADAHRRAGRLVEAMACCRAAVAARPADPKALHLLGLLLCDLGEREEGFGLLRRSVAVTPVTDRALAARVRSNLAGVLWRSGGQAAEAEAAGLLAEAVRLDPRHAAAQHNLGVALRAAGRLGEAETSFRKAVALRPRYADAHAHLGEALRERGQLADADTGQPVAGSVTFPQGVYTVYVKVTPIDDSTPEWTEDIVATLAPGTPPEFRVGQSSSAVVQIVDNDFGFTLQQGTLVANYDDDDGNGVTDYNDTSSGGGDDDLYEMQLKVPQEPKAGTSITVNLPPDMVNAYDSQSKGTKLLGDDPNVGTIRFDDDHPAPSSIWLEVKDGSSEENDLLVSASSHDVGTRPSGNSQSQRNTAVNVKIVSNNDPNGGAAGEVTNKTIDKWLVGQMVDMYVYVKAPAAQIQNVTFQWDVPGNVLRDYVIDSTAATPIQLGDSHDGNEHVPLNGKKQADIKFFWVTTDAVPPGPDTRKISVTISNVGDIVLPPVSTTFRVFSPISSFSRVTGTAGFVTTPRGNFGMGLAADANSPDGGIVSRGAVQVPAGFGQGSWHFVQLWNRYEVQTSKPPQNETVQRPNPSTWGLDNSYPYPDFLDPFDAGSSVGAWRTGPAGKRTYDSPFTQLADFVKLCTIDHQWETYAVFLPPGAGSKWVPLQKMTWTLHLGAGRDADDHWYFLTRQFSAGQFAPVTMPPTWVRVHRNGDPLEPVP